MHAYKNERKVLLLRHPCIIARLYPWLVEIARELLLRQGSDQRAEIHIIADVFFQPFHPSDVIMGDSDRYTSI